MFTQFKIGTRIQSAFAMVFMLAMLAVGLVNQSYTRDLISSAEQGELDGYMDSLVTVVEQRGLMAEALAEQIANSPAVQEAFANGDRATLNDMLQNTFATLKAQYGVEQMQFHTPPATSFLRLHKPEKFGDDLSGFRDTVVRVNETRTRIHGVEQGVAGLGIRGVVPVAYKGQHVGSVEIGLAFNEDFFNHFETMHGVEVGFQVQTDGGFKSLVSAFEGGSYFSQEELSSVIGGATLLRQTDYKDKPYAVYAEQIRDYSGQPFAVVVLAMDRSHYADQMQEAGYAQLAIGAVALLVGIVLFGLLSATVVRPLHQAAESMEEIASGQGDLTSRLPVNGRDELAQLAESFNRFVARIQDTVKHVMDSSTKVASSAEGMLEITLVTSDGVQRQRNEIESVATAMNEMTATVQEVARNAANAAQAANEANLQSQNGRKVVENNIQSIRKLANEIGSTAELINKLSDDSESIGSVLDVIRGIAEQTNLLALNAAIEAARAGEQGRGFAVVADEVRTLAQRTQESTREIRDMIERLQSGARDAVTAMEKGREQTESAVGQAASAGDALSSITRAVGSISDMNTQIATAAEEQSAVAEEINRNIATINTVADQAADAAAQTATASEEMSGYATELQSLVARFKV